MSAPCFSVLMTCFNGERFLRPAIESVLAQTLPEHEYEFVAVDDSSTDRSLDILKSYGDRIRVLVTPRNLGSNRDAFLFGLDRLRGRIIVPMDCDDLFAPSKLRVLKERFEADPAIGFVGHEMDVIGPDGVRLGRLRHALDLAAVQDSVRRSALIRSFVFTLRSAFIGSSYAVRREFYDGFRPSERRIPMGGGHDTTSASLVALCPEAVLDYSPLVLGAYRWHEGQESGFFAHGGRLPPLCRLFRQRELRWRWLASRWPGYRVSCESSVGRLVLVRHRHRIAAFRGELALMGSLLAVLTIGMMGRRVSPGGWLSALFSTALTFLTGPGWDRPLQRRAYRAVLEGRRPSRWMSSLLGM